MFPTMAFLLKAGEIREEGEILPMIQGLSLQQVEAVADWLALATASGGPCPSGSATGTRSTRG